MSTAVLTPVTPARPAVRPAWIISRRDDLTWFIGSAAAGYLAILLMWSGFPILPLQAVWFFGVDGPHVLSTVTRTYFDRAERKKQGWFLWIVLPLLLIGPAMALTGHVALFFMAAFCWQQFHVTKQHFGFVMLYKAKNRERNELDRKLDRWFLLASLFVPLALFILKTQNWDFPTLLRQAALAGYGVLTAPLALVILKTPNWLPALLPQVALAGYAGLIAVWLGRQFQKLRSGEALNWPKLALIAAVAPLQWLALGFGARFGPEGVLQAAIPLGLFHGLQYHRLMWFHNRNRYSTPDAEEKHGLAATLASRVWIYLAVAIGLHFVLTFLPQFLFPYQTVTAAIWGIAFTHYCLDARIWRVRGDKELASVLHLA